MKIDNEDYDMVSSKPTTAASFDEDLEGIFRDVMQLPLDHPIPLVIYHHAGISTWQQFTYLDEVDVERAVYPDETEHSNKALTNYEQKLLGWLIGYVRESIDAHQPGSDKASFYTQKGFTAYTQERRKKQRLRSRYGKGGRESPRGGKKTFKDHIIDFVENPGAVARDVLDKVEKTTTEVLGKVQKTTSEVFEKQSARMKQSRASAQNPNNESHESREETPDKAAATS